MEGLKDIKDIVVVPDYSFWIFLLTIFVSILAIGLIIYLYKNRRRKRKKPTNKELAKQRLKSIDFKDQKKAIYTFSVDGSLFVNEKNRELFQKIEKNLTQYKYKKETPPLDSETKKMIKEFIRSIT